LADGIGMERLGFGRGGVGRGKSSIIQLYEYLVVTVVCQYLYLQVSLFNESLCT
jgi:hypothetical protein